MADKTSVIEAVCSALADGARDTAADLLRRDYPFAPESPKGRTYNRVDATRIFVRDGFIDRYSGWRVVFPPALRLISVLLPEHFPYHVNWKMDVTHPAFWQLSATIDHVLPIARGGADDDSNRVTTSMLRNAAKANWTLEELAWRLLPTSSYAEWDGLARWFMDYMAAHEEVAGNGLRAWWRAAKTVMGSR